MNPNDDKFEDNIRIQLKESTKALITCTEEVESTEEMSSMVEKLWNDSASLVEMNSTDDGTHFVDHGCQNELFQKVVSNSLESSIHLLEDNMSNWHKSKSHPPQWPETSKILIREEAKAFFQKENEIQYDDTENSSSSADKVESIPETRSSQTRLITYPNGDTYLGSIHSVKKTKEDYGGNFA